MRSSASLQRGCVGQTCVEAGSSSPFRNALFPASFSFLFLFCGWAYTLNVIGVVTSDTRSSCMDQRRDCSAGLNIVTSADTQSVCVLGQDATLVLIALIVQTCTRCDALVNGQRFGYGTKRSQNQVLQYRDNTTARSP